MFFWSVAKMGARGVREECDYMVMRGNVLLVSVMS